MRGLAAVCLSCICYLLAFTGGTLGQGQGPVIHKVFVKEDDDAVLPCSPNTRVNLERKLFDWRKDGQKDGRKEVFLYDAGNHYNNGFRGQDEQFIDRVSHFQDQLMNGNASIKIRNTKMDDSGIYSCIFPHLQPSQTFKIKLVVGRILKDRTGEIPGTCPKPLIEILDATKDQVLLQCEVRGASPKPEVTWQNSSGNILPAEEPQVLESEGSYSVILKINVTKTDLHRCVATQDELRHQIHAETFVFISENLSSVSEKLCEDPSSVSEDPSTKVIIGWLGGIFIGAVVLAAVQALLVATKRITIRFYQGTRHLGAGYNPSAETTVALRPPSPV